MWGQWFLIVLNSIVMMVIKLNFSFSPQYAYILFVTYFTVKIPQALRIIKLENWIVREKLWVSIPPWKVWYNKALLFSKADGLFIGVWWPQ